MTNNYLKKIKIYFSIVILVLITGIIGGSFVVKDGIHFTTKYALETFNYFKYKLSFAYAPNKDLSASASIFLGLNEDNIVYNRSGYKKQYTKSMPVLLYHSIVNEPDEKDVILENFKEQMFALKKAGWQTVSIKNFYSFMQGEKELPDKSFLLTFDDGTKDSYYPVDPILKVLDYNAVSFIISKYSIGKGSGSNYYLSENEIKRMVKNGRWEIQSHGRNAHNFYKINVDKNEGHFLSNKLWIDNENRIETEEEFSARIFGDLIRSKSEIENNLKIKVISFSFLFSDFGQRSKNFPKAEYIVLDTVKPIYPVSFYQVWGDYTYNYPDKDSFMAKRIGVNSEWSAENLLEILENGKVKILPYKTGFEKNDGWIKKWGNISFENKMRMVPSENKTSSAVVLDGSYLWTDYVLNAKILLNKGKTFTVFGRFKNDDNFVSCVYSDKFIKMEQTVNGKKEILTEWTGSLGFVGKNREVGIAFSGDAADCYLDGKIVIRGYNLNANLNNGGIGFKAWDPEVGNSELIIKEVFVEEIK